MAGELRYFLRKPIYVFTSNVAKCSLLFVAPSRLGFVLLDLVKSNMVTKVRPHRQWKELQRWLLSIPYTACHCVWLLRSRLKMLDDIYISSTYKKIPCV